MADAKPLSGLENIKADILIRAQKIYSLHPDIPLQKAVAIRGQHIWAFSQVIHGLDSCIGHATRVIDEPTATVLPSFDDTHTHLIFAGLSEFDVPVHAAKDIKELLNLIRHCASQTEPGQWITTTADWQEFNLKEQRFPTLQELDEVSNIHPIVVRRGGHNIVVNSCAAALANITPATQPPLGGIIGINREGKLNGLLQDSATKLIECIRPPVSLERRVSGLDRASRKYAATGIGCVRDCFVPVADLAYLKAAHDAGRLNVRVRALVSTLGLSTVSDVDQILSEMEQWRHLQTDPWFSIWGVKFMIDGGIEAGATEEPYVNQNCGCAGHEACGRLLWDTEELVEAMDAVIRRGWRIGTHAYGDRAVRRLLDVYEVLLRRHPHLSNGTLVMEHGGLATPAQQARAVALGIAITIQQPLLHDVAGVQETYWGVERVNRLFPARQWLNLGADISGGSDYPVGMFGAMRSIWGMSTRQTVAGVRGPEHAISVSESIALHTTAAAKMLKESETRGSLRVGSFADLTLWSKDPFEVAEVCEIRDFQPLYTIIGGQIKHSPK